MGWWRIEGSQNVIGDGPLESLGEAARQVVQAYEAEFKRRPTRAEWEALLLGVLGAEEAEAQLTEDGPVKRVRLDLDL